MISIMFFVILGIIGLAALISGKLKLTAAKEVTGPVARLVGVILLLPAPLLLLASTLLTAVLLSQGPAETLEQRMPNWVPLMGFGIGGLCLIVAVVIGSEAAKAVPNTKAESGPSA